MTEKTPAQQGRENWRHGKGCEWRFYKDGRVPVNPHLVGGVFTVDGHQQASCTCGLAAFLAEHDQQARDLEQAKEKLVRQIRRGDRAEQQLAALAKMGHTL